MAKSIFDRENHNYIVLDSNHRALEKIVNLIKSQPFSILLLYGSPGVGKTCLIKRCYELLKDSENIHLQQVPFYNAKDFLKEIFVMFLDSKPTNTSSITSILTELNEKLDKKITLFLDEAQMYKDEDLELIRLLSDCKKIQVVLSLHKIEKEDVMIKEYFTSRIWETIELSSLSKDELKSYISKQLFLASLSQLNVYFDDKNCNIIHSLTKGNLRTLNKFLFKIFDMYHYYDTNEPSKISSGKILNKHIEMIALDMGIIK
mgnify:CR=1 FL=1